MGHPPTYKLSKHARQRATEMGLRTKDLKRAVRDPDCRYPGSKKYDNGATCYQRGDLVVVAHDEDRRILTVLYHRATGR